MTGIVILAAALRLYELDFQSLWLNELDSWFISQHEDVGVILGRTAIEDLHPPGYQLILWAWIRVFGDTEFALRLLSVVTGTLAVGVIGLLGRQLFDRATGLVSAMFSAILWVPIYYSQEARSYGTLLLASVLSTYLTLKVVRRLEDGGDVTLTLRIGWVAAALLTAYLHYFGLLVVGFHLLLILIRVGARRSTVGMTATFALLYLPWVPSMLADRSADHWLTAPSLRSWPGFYSFAFNRTPFLALIALPLQLWALLDAVRDVSHQSDRWRAVRRHPFTVLALWIAVPTTLAFLASFLLRPVWLDRSLIVAVAPLYILLARGLVALPSRFAAQAATVAVAAAFVVNLVVSQGYYSTPTKESYRDAVAYVVDNDAAASTPIVGVRHAYYYDYYLDRLSRDDRKVAMTVLTESDEKDLKDLARSSPSNQFWFLDGPFFRPEPGLQAVLDRDFSAVDSAEFVGARAILYRLDDP